MSGGETGAIEGTLSIMVGAERGDFEEVKPILETMGTTVVLVGSPGSGQTVKAANQLIVAGTIELVAEAIVFLRAYGVDTEAAVAVLAGGLAGNQILERKAANMLAGNFQPGFRIDLHHKDMGIVIAAARERDVAIPLGALTAQLLVPSGRKVTASWTTRPCFAAWSACLGVTTWRRVTTRVVLAPDKFKGSLTAAEVAKALAAGMQDVLPGLETIMLPVADGGDGTVAAALSAGFAKIIVDAVGPTGEPVSRRTRWTVIGPWSNWLQLWD